MFGLSTSLPLAPSPGVMLPPPPFHRISPYALDSIRAQNKKNLRPVPVISKRADKVMFSDKEIEKFDELAVKWNSGSISMKELILELRGGDLAEWVAKFGITMAIIIVLNNVDAFQVPPGTIVPPHLQGLYGNQQPGNHFGYGKGAGPRSITVTGATNSGYGSKNLPSYTEKIIFFDGYEAEMLNSSLDHLLSKHGHSFGINDALVPNPNQKPTKYPQIRTRINSCNRDQFRENLKEFGQNPDLIIFENVNIRGTLGRVYFSEETGRVVALETQGPNAGRITKAQPISGVQINILRGQNRLD